LCWLNLGQWYISYFSPLITADGYFFCLATKEAKIQVASRLLLFAQGLYPAKPGSTTGFLYFAAVVAQGLRFCKI